MTGFNDREKRWGMRFFVFVLSLMASSISLAGKPVFGVVSRDGSGLFLEIEQNPKCAKFEIKTKSAEATESVRKLSNGDYLTATGLLDLQLCKVVIESIDYVGLKKLLGYWYSADGIISVRDFNSLSFYPIDGMVIQEGALFKTVEPIDYRYSVTPSDGKEWVLFLSDKKSTTFATIQFLRETAIIKLYDSDNGDITKTFYFSKWGNLR